MADPEKGYYEKARIQRRDAPTWKKRLTIEHLKPKRKRFQRRRVYSPSVDAIWTGDLLDIHKYARQNLNHKFILVIIDTFSKYVWAKGLKNKTAIATANAIEDVIINESKTSPEKLWTDRGTEFYNTAVNRVLREHHIHLYSTHNDVKASIAERFIRTLRRKIESNFVITHSTEWYYILPQLLHEYNTTYHESISMTPQEARDPTNFQKVYESLYNNNKQKNKTPEQIRKERTPVFQVGDKVRISLNKRLFEKEASANWSEEIFEISDVLMQTRPIVYKIKDLAGEEIEGAFYKEQLQKTYQDIYRVDRIVRRRQKADGTSEVLVNWMGYPEKFNSWEPAENILRSGAALAL